MDNVWTVAEARFVLNYLLATNDDIGFKILGVTMTYSLLSKVRPVLLGGLLLCLRASDSET